MTKKQTGRGKKKQVAENSNKTATVKSVNTSAKSKTRRGLDKDIKQTENKTAGKLKTGRDKRNAARREKNNQTANKVSNRRKVASPVKPTKTNLSNITSSPVVNNKKSMRKAKKVAPVQKSNGGNLNNKSTKATKKKKNSTSANQTNNINNIKTNDTEAVLSEEEEVEEKVIMKEILVKGDAAVDEHVMNGHRYRVVQAAPLEFGDNKYFTATLNLSDLKKNNNKFYILQLLLEEQTNKYYFYTRWGRVGHKGQLAYDVCNNINLTIYSLVKMFKKGKNKFLRKYRDKTMTGEYKPLTIDYTSKNKEDIKSNKPEKKSKLEEALQGLMSLIYDINIMNQQMKKIGYDANKLPLGKLGDETLKDGYKILKEIEAVLDGSKKGDLYALTSEFYSKIPHNFGFKKMSNFIINTKDLIKEKVDMLESLSDIEIATQILEDAKKHQEEDPLESHYLKLGCKIRHIKNNEEIFDVLNTYLVNSSSDNRYRKLQLVEAFELERAGEYSRYKDHLGNKMLLWHGSRITNYVGILSQGLRIAPPEAPSSGYLFGKGVYFADMASKSACYCYPSNDIALILLCEVALGNPNELLTTDHKAANLPSGKHSTKGCGRMTPGDDYYDLDGVVVPYGKPKASTKKTLLGYNEYIVYDTSQVKLRYLLKIKFS